MSQKESEELLVHTLESFARKRAQLFHTSGLVDQVRTMSGGFFDGMRYDPITWNKQIMEFTHVGNTRRAVTATDNVTTNIKAHSSAPRLKFSVNELKTIVTSYATAALNGLTTGSEQGHNAWFAAIASYGATGLPGPWREENEYTNRAMYHALAAFVVIDKINHVTMSDEWRSGALRIPILESFHLLMNEIYACWLEAATFALMLPTSTLKIRKANMTVTPPHQFTLALTRQDAFTKEMFGVEGERGRWIHIVEYSTGHMDLRNRHLYNQFTDRNHSHLNLLSLADVEELYNFFHTGHGRKPVWYYSCVRAGKLQHFEPSPMQYPIVIATIRQAVDENNNEFETGMLNNIKLFWPPLSKYGPSVWETAM
jgi:hypothetical protein